MAQTRRQHPAPTAVTAVLLTLACLTGCTATTPETPTTDTTPAATTTPLFANDTEALAAAKAAFQRYLDVSNAIGQDGWRDPSALKTVSTGAALKDGQSISEDYKAKGLVQSGLVTYDSARFQSSNASGVAVYLCMDAGSTKLLNSQGQDVTPSGRQDRVPIVVKFTATQNSKTLLLEDSSVWPGSNFC